VIFEPCTFAYFARYDTYEKHFDPVFIQHGIGRAELPGTK
jgi:hypothetical protein